MFLPHRIIPELYLEAKETLLTECDRLDGLRLADARQVVKIDVNKTRKLYDFFLSRKLIRKPEAK